MTANDFPRCATCKHWTLNTGHTDWGACIGMAHDGVDPDYEGIFDGLNTEDTFGCINHSEIKEE